MGMGFWIRRFAMVFAIAFVVIAGAQLLQDETLVHAVTQGLTWAAVSTSIFIGSRIHQSRKGVACALCKDLPTPPPATGDDTG